MAKKENNVADKLFIAELIRKVHDELIRSQEIRESEEKAPIFTVKDLTIEVNFVATEVSNKQGGLDFKIITAEANKEYSTQQIHRIVLNLVVNNEKMEKMEMPTSNILDVLGNVQRYKTKQDVFDIPGIHPKISPEITI